MRRRRVKAGSMQASVLTQVSYVNWTNPAIVAIVRGVILCHFKDVVFEWKKHSVLSTFLMGDSHAIPFDKTER